MLRLVTEGCLAVQFCGFYLCSMKRYKKCTVINQNDGILSVVLFGKINFSFQVFECLIQYVWIEGSGNSRPVELSKISYSF